ncbi:gasdermin-E-like [Esox lucius]|nr:gasdermin-E-like [Esox lucius]
MISTAIKTMLKEVDSEGCLIPVSSLNNNSDKLNVLSVIVKIRPRKDWFWKKPKYQFHGFTLSDVLEPGVPEDTPLSPKCTYIGNYEAVVGDKMNADTTVDGLVAGLNLNLDMDCSYNASFGRLKKEEVEVTKLLNHLKDKLLDMNHPWIRQACAKPRAVLCILKERIMTTDACHFNFNVKKSGDIGAKQCIPSNPSTAVKTSMHQKVRKQIDKKVDLEIPPNTVVAFGVFELKIRCNGKFDLCLLSNKGGFEKKESDTGFENDAVLGGYDPNIPLNLSNELEKLSDHFQVLSVLPTETRSNLLQLLRNTMKNREEVSVLESVLNQMCDDETPDLGDLTESERKTVQAIVDLVDADDKEFRSSLLSAVHLIVGAMDEIPDEGLSELESCCSPPVLKALKILVQCVAAGSGETLSLTDAGLTILTEEEVYGKAQSLFDLSNVILKREEDTLKAEMKDQPGYLPLFMSVAVKGLASLV